MLTMSLYIDMDKILVNFMTSIVKITLQLSAARFQGWSVRLLCREGWT